jgi:hypothetical protein
MFCFSLGTISTIGRAKHLNRIGIVDQGMLSREQYTFSNTCYDKNILKAMEIGEQLSKARNVLGRDSILTNNVATAHKRREALDKLSRNMAMNCCDVDL